MRLNARHNERGRKEEGGMDWLRSSRLRSALWAAERRDGANLHPKVLLLNV
jgi:hypothetical protein